MDTPLCPYCGQASQWLPDSEVYAKGYGGYVYACIPCDAHIGCHKQGDHKTAKGSLANKELRRLRIQAHSLFDPLWRFVKNSRKISKTQARRKAYTWLARELGMKVDDCHIGMLRDDEVKRVIAICEKVYAKAVKV